VASQATLSRVSEAIGGGLTTWIEVSRSAIGHNLRLFRRLVAPGTGVLAVVKANAYGHGLAQAVEACAGEGVEMLGVHTADEVLELRRLGVSAPVLAMGYLTAEQI